MTLQVPFEDFARTAQKLAGVKEVFLSAHPAGALVTCANPKNGVHVVSVSHGSHDETAEALQKEGLETFSGVWAEDAEIRLEADPLTTVVVAAVSYVSSEHVPGVWVDAYAETPTHVQVLRSMFEEFRDTGEIEDISFEEFVRLSVPNVVVVSASQLRGYLDAKAERERKQR